MTLDAAPSTKQQKGCRAAPDAARDGPSCLTRSARAFSPRPPTDQRNMEEAIQYADDLRASNAGTQDLLGTQVHDTMMLRTAETATGKTSGGKKKKKVSKRESVKARARQIVERTALMHDVFSTIANRSSPPYTCFDVRAFEDAELVVTEVTGKGLDRAARRRFREADIVLDYHFGKSLPAFIEQNETTRLLQSMISVSNAREYRIVHVVRDPLDVLVSGLAYHARSPNDERWLSRARVAELSYAEFLKTASPKDAIAAEMSFSDDEIRMLALTYVQCERNRDTCLNLRLEAFERNFDRTLERALRFLRFPSQNITSMIQIASVHDVSKWSEDELRKNEHYTKRIDRRPYYEAAREDDDIWRTITALRRAMGYDATS